MPGLSLPNPIKTITYLLDEKLVPVIIGHGGKTIKEIESKLHTKLNLSSIGSPRELTVSRQGSHNGRGHPR